jgi:mediator of RNA polymerase II transcription subunit 6
MESLEDLIASGKLRVDDQTTVSWRDEGWLQHNELDNRSAMTYFSLSVFYDRSANNEKTKEDLSRLKYMKGLEFVLVQSKPEAGIYHIRKQFRHGEKKFTQLALYYILGGYVYQAPSLAAVLNAKLRNIAKATHDCFRLAP